MGPVAAVVGAVVAVVGTVKSHQAQKKAARAQKKSAEEQRKQQQIATRRSRRQAIRGAQIARAQAIAAGGASGAYGSSAQMGGVGSLGSQLGAEFGYSTAMSGLSDNISRYNQRAADANMKAQTWGSIASLGGSLFSASGGFSNFQGKPPTQAPMPTPQFNYGPTRPQTQPTAAPTTNVFSRAI